MQDLIVALYEDHAAAEKVRTELVKDGFATDRVELTSPREHRQAAMGPADAFETGVKDYFRTLSADDTAERALHKFAEAVVRGASAVTVHPRGEEELKRADAILGRGGPLEVYRYVPQDAGHVVDRKIERAAMPPRQ